MALNWSENISAYRGRSEKEISLSTQSIEDDDQVEDPTALEAPTSEGDGEDSPSPSPPLFQLPPELVQQILSYFSAQELARVSATCRGLAEHATNELLWSNLVNAHLPFKIYDPGSFNSFRELYVAHHPCWFIPRGKIWFSDWAHTGNLILTRYDNRRGVIEGYRVVAERQNHQFQVWTRNPDVIIQTFHPKVSLWLDDPVLLLKNSPFGSSGEPHYVNGEACMPMALQSQNIFSFFSLCYDQIPSQIPVNPSRRWPPLTIPSDHRVYRDLDAQFEPLRKPAKRAEEISEFAFRLRRVPHFGMGVPLFSAGSHETLATYATLDPSLYTPTREKPYQGIWVGDYSAHGCEFLLFLQHGLEERSNGPNNVTASQSPEPNELSGSGDETDQVIQQGSLEAIKLTGDPNVPRGEISFEADDIGQSGVVRTADEPLFEGSRIVHSRGHVAGLGFRDGKHNL